MIRSGLNPKGLIAYPTAQSIRRFRDRVGALMRRCAPVNRYLQFEPRTEASAPARLLRPDKGLVGREGCKGFERIKKN